MSHKLDEIESTSSMVNYSTVLFEEDRERCELVHGEWREKHCASLVEEVRKGSELINGEWVEKQMSNSSTYFGGNAYTHIRSVVMS